MSGIQTLYVASGNPGKIREFQAACPPNLQLKAVPNFQDLTACIEDGESFEANAHKKALHYSRMVDGLLFADDSGICVDALGGAPGVRSARYAGPRATDKENNRKLVGALSHISPEQATAYYVCVIGLARGANLLSSFEGRAEGLILQEPRGSGGFGYDPYFFHPPLSKTFAELSPEEKFKVSHRGQAFRALLDYLSRLGSI